MEKFDRGIFFRQWKYTIFLAPDEIDNLINFPALESIKPRRDGKMETNATRRAEAISGHFGERFSRVLKALLLFSTRHAATPSMVILFRNPVLGPSLLLFGCRGYTLQSSKT